MVRVFVLDNYYHWVYTVSMMKPILVDFDPDRLQKLEIMKKATALPRNDLIRRAVDFFFVSGEWLEEEPETKEDIPAGTT